MKKVLDGDKKDVLEYKKRGKGGESHLSAEIFENRIESKKRKRNVNSKRRKEGTGLNKKREKIESLILAQDERWRRA